MSAPEHRVGMARSGSNLDLVMALRVGLYLSLCLSPRHGAILARGQRNPSMDGGPGPSFRFY